MKGADFTIYCPPLRGGHWSLALPAQDNLTSKEIGEDIEKQHIGSRAKT